MRIHFAWIHEFNTSGCTHNLLTDPQVLSVCSGSEHIHFGFSLYANLLQISFISFFVCGSIVLFAAPLWSLCSSNCLISPVAFCLESYVQSLSLSVTLLTHCVHRYNQTFLPGKTFSPSSVSSLTSGCFLQCSAGLGEDVSSQSTCCCRAQEHYWGNGLSAGKLC